MRVKFQNSIREVLGLSLDQTGDYLEDGHRLLTISCRKPAYIFKENTSDSSEFLSTNQSAPSYPTSFDPEIISKAEKKVTNKSRPAVPRNSYSYIGRVLGNANNYSFALNQGN